MVGGDIDDGMMLVVDVRVRIVVDARVEGEAKTGDVGDDLAAQDGALFADAAGEDERVDVAVERDEVGPDVGRDAVDQESEGEVVWVVPRIRGWGVGGDVLKVRCAREGFPAGLFVEDFFGLGKELEDNEVRKKGRESLGGGGRKKGKKHTVVMCISLVLLGLG